MVVLQSPEFEPLKNCFFLVFHKQRSPALSDFPFIYIGGNVIHRVYEAKYHGVTMDANLKFNLHTQRVVKKHFSFVPIL